ncbi:MAG: lysophospholipid acyltransferase family protein [Chitinophagaceae bacterium]
MYYILYPLFYLLSLLPWFVMYGISDFLYMVAYKWMKYRRDVVMANLAIAFPEKSLEEREKIASDFYHHFIDTLVETIKVLSMTDKELSERYEGNAEGLNQILDEGKNLQIHAMHNFNWEIVHLNFVKQLRYPFLAVYMPVQNKTFDRIMLKLRGRYGTKLISAWKFKTAFHQYKDDPYMLALVADQTPGTPAKAYWLPFFGRMTPFVAGPEKGARFNNTAVVFCNFYPTKRGHYAFDYTLITKNAAELTEVELTKKFVKYVEDCIRKNPSNYLWSHRRWKHAFNEEYRNNVIAE